MTAVENVNYYIKAGYDINWAIKQGLEIEKEENIQREILHKQQIKDAYNQGYREGLEDVGNVWLCDKDVAECSNSESYYNETFKK
jgi:hypothetical protein